MRGSSHDTKNNKLSSGKFERVKKQEQKKTTKRATEAFGSIITPSTLSGVKQLP